jgi:hypothetical protein
VGMYLVTRALSRRGLGGWRAGARIPRLDLVGACPGAIQAWIKGGAGEPGLNFRALSGACIRISINYRGARQIAWLMFQTLLCRSALAAVFSSAVWVRDNERPEKLQRRSRKRLRVTIITAINRDISQGTVSPDRPKRYN